VKRFFLMRNDLGCFVSGISYHSIVHLSNLSIYKNIFSDFGDSKQKDNAGFACTSSIGDDALHIYATSSSMPAEYAGIIVLQMGVSIFPSGISTGG